MPTTAAMAADNWSAAALKAESKPPAQSTWQPSSHESNTTESNTAGYQHLANMLSTNRFRSLIIKFFFTYRSPALGGRAAIRAAGQRQLISGRLRSCMLMPRHPIINATHVRMPLR